MLYNRIECLMVITLVLYYGQDKSIENNGYASITPPQLNYI